MASGPCSMKLSGNQPDLANAGNSRVYSHNRKPSDNPLRAPARVPCFQYMPPSIAGANCATAANDTRPIETSA
ncbi:hypothetical protein FQZ97_1060320 [compost metagenome]